MASVSCESLIRAQAEDARDDYKSLREGRGQLNIFWAVCLDHSPESLPICLGAVGERQCDAVGRDGFNSRAVEGDQQLLKDIIFSEHS